MTRAAYFPFTVIQPSGKITIGVPFDTKPHPDDYDAEIMVCPVCGADLTDKYIPGYGLAYGGFGAYWYCTSEDCEWFYKEMARDDE